LDRTVSPGEFALAQEAARAAGLWRLGGVQDQ
jgi:hypothetical protein